MNNNSDTPINGVNNLNNQAPNTTPTNISLQPQVNNSYQVNSVNATPNNQNTTPNNNFLNPAIENIVPQPAPSNEQLTNNSNVIIQQNINQTPSNDTSINDEELLKAFIGKNYDKITTKPFNFAGFFFTVFYMFYRKMFLYGTILAIAHMVILCIVNSIIVTIIFIIAMGLLANKIYLYYSKKKIIKIKLQNPQKNINELKDICSKKGGTSILILILGILDVLAIIIITSIIIVSVGIGNGIKSLSNNFNNLNITVNNKDTTNDSVSLKDTTLVENVNVMGYACFGSNCKISIEEADDTTSYVLDASNVELIKMLGDYNDYVKLNIYYTQKENQKTIVKYEVFLKTNNENISKIKSEEELRTKIGLYNEGIYTDTFTLSEIGIQGGGWKGDDSYSYVDYTLTDSKNNMYDMKYIITDDVDYNYLNSVLVKGNKYTVTFEVKKDTFGYEYYIKDTK